MSACCNNGFKMVYEVMGFKMWMGLIGPPGPAGATFTPAVSSAGVISWTNDGGLPNPSPVDIKGPPGEPQTPSDAEPLMDGTASAGISTDYARGDHRHPSDYNKAPVITDTASGSVASFPDGADNLPVKSLVVRIVPVQAEGTPSRESPLPISGWTGCELTRTGKNLLPSDSRKYQNGIINSEGDVVEQNSYMFLKEYLPILPATVYSLSAKKNTTSNLALSVAFYDSDKNFLVRSFAWGPGATTGRVSGSVTSPQNAAYCRLNIWSSRSLGENFQYERGSATDYETYNGSNYDIIFPSPDPDTVYAGTLEWIGDNKWKLKARPYYASYNGETLVGPWVSSMDDYAPGTNPTSGAQVVDLGGVETQYIITIPDSDPATLPGINNFWANCGPVSVEFRADTKLYIDKKLAALVAALS